MCHTTIFEYLHKEYGTLEAKTEDIGSVINIDVANAARPPCAFMNA